MSQTLADTLLWLCRIPSPIGEERALCDAVAERVSTVSTAAPIRRYGDSLVVPLTRQSGGPHVVLAGHLAESAVGAFLGDLPHLQVSHFPERAAEPEVDFVLTIGTTETSGLPDPSRRVSTSSVRRSTGK